MTTGFVGDSLLTGHRVSRPSTERRALRREDRSLNRVASGDALPLVFPAFMARRRKLPCRDMASSGTPECALSLRRLSPHQFLVMLGHCFGAKPAPCGSASFCFACSAPAGSRFLPKQVCKRGQERRTNFFRAPPRKHSLALGSRATRWLCQG